MSLKQLMINIGIIFCFVCFILVASFWHVYHLNLYHFFPLMTGWLQYLSNWPAYLDSPHSSLSPRVLPPIYISLKIPALVLSFFGRNFNRIFAICRLKPSVLVWLINLFKLVPNLLFHYFSCEQSPPAPRRYYQLHLCICFFMNLLNVLYQFLLMSFFVE